MVGRDAERERGRNEDAETLRRHRRHGFGTERIRAKRPVRPVLFRGAYRQQDTVRPVEIGPDFGPGETIQPHGDSI